MERGSNAKGQIPNSMYPQHGNSIIELKVKVRHKMFNREVVNLKRKKVSMQDKDIQTRPN